MTAPGNQSQQGRGRTCGSYTRKLISTCSPAPRFYHQMDVTVHNVLWQQHRRPSEDFVLNLVDGVALSGRSCMVACPSKLLPTASRNQSRSCALIKSLNAEATIFMQTERKRSCLPNIRSGHRVIRGELSTIVQPQGSEALVDHLRCDPIIRRASEPSKNGRSRGRTVLPLLTPFS